MGEEQLKHLTCSPQSRQTVTEESPFLAANINIWAPFSLVSLVKFSNSGERVLNSLSFLVSSLKSIMVVLISGGNLHLTFSNSDTSPCLYLYKVSVLKNESPKTRRMFFLRASASAKNRRSIKGRERVLQPFLFSLSIIMVPKSFLGRNNHLTVPITSME